MAGVRVISPEGERGEIPESSVEAALAEGFSLDDGVASAASPEVAAEAPPSQAMVRVRSPEGEEGMVPADRLQAAKDEGFTDLALEERYGTFGQKAATVGEGLARGATLGISDAVQAYGAGIGTALGNMLADKTLPEVPRAAGQGIDAPLAEPVDRPLFDKAAQIEAGADIAGRREANKALAVGSELVGAVAPAVLSGGVGSAGALARMTPAGQLANLATKMGAALTARAATGVGRIGALALTGAAEAAVDNATRTVVGDLAAGNVDITAERALEAAWDGAKWGGLVGGGLGAVAEGAQAAGRGVAAVARGVGEKLGTLSDQAGSAAFKAATGRTSIAAQRLAARVGGDAEIGKTLLKRGVIAETLGGGHTVDDIAERLPGALDDAGRELGDLLGEVADAPTSRASILKRIEDEVIGPLDKAGTKDIAVAVRAKLQNSGIVDELSKSGDDAIQLRELHELRRRFDQRPDLKWGSTGPGPVDITTDAMRDVRRTIEDAFEKASDDAAKARGLTDFADRLKQAKREYSHLAVANQVSEQGAFARAANNRLGLNDVLAGVAGAASLGPAGALAAVGSKLVRDRSESIIAATLYRLARGAVKQEQAIEGAVANTVRSLSLPAVAVTAAARGAVPSAEAMQRMVAQAQALQDPESPESHQLEAQTLQLASESPEFADAMKAAVMRKASMVVQRMGPSTDPADPLARQPMPVDRVTKSRNERFLRAVQNPSAALDRLASGQGSPEDLAVVRELTPQIHKRYVDGVMAQIVGGKQQLTMAQRQRLLFALGTPVVREQTPEYVRFYQQLLAGRGQEGQQQEQVPAGLPENRKATGVSNELKVDTHFASRADAITGGIGE